MKSLNKNVTSQMKAIAFFIAYGYHLANPITDLVWIYLESLVAAYVVWKLYNRLCGCIK